MDRIEINVEIEPSINVERWARDKTGIFSKIFIDTDERHVQ